MDKYIKAQDAIDAFARYIWSPLPRSISYADLVVNKIPVADVIPAIHGEWIDEIDPWAREHCNKCSICQKISYNTDYLFCPWCGAKMDGDENV